MNNKYFDMAVEYYTNISSDKKYNSIKKLFYSTQLSGPHLDFYHLPYSFNKSTPFENFKKFQRKIIKSINNLLSCEKNHMYLPKQVILSMIEQLDIVLNVDNKYWENFGFNTNEVESIKKTYMLYRHFLETYVMRLPSNTINEEVYKYCLKQCIGTDISPRNLQKFGIAKVKQLINHIQDLSGRQFFDLLGENQRNGTSIQSETELASYVMECILKLHEHTKELFNSTNIIIPEPHKIKIKPIPQLMTKWSSNARTSGRYLFLDMSNLNSFKKEHIMQLCVHEVMPGHIMLRKNADNVINTYLEGKNIPKNIKKLMKSGLNAFYEGYACYVESMMFKLYDNLIGVYLSHLFNAVRVIIDTGLNSSDVEIHLDYETAKAFMKRMTLLSDELINSEILRCLASPGQSSSCTYGHDMISLLGKKLLAKGYFKLDFCKMIYTLPLPFDILLKYADEIEENEETRLILVN